MHGTAVGGRWLEVIRKYRLGEILRRKGLITESQLERALRTQRQLLEERRRLEEMAGLLPAAPVSPLGQILVRMGAVSRPRVEEALRAQRPQATRAVPADAGKRGAFPGVTGGVPSAELPGTSGIPMPAAPTGTRTVLGAVAPGSPRWGAAVVSGAAVGAAGRLEEVLHRILQGAVRVAGCQAGALVLLGERVTGGDGGAPCFCVGIGPAARPLTGACRLGGGIVGQVIRLGEAALVADARGAADLVPQLQPLDGFTVQTILCVPLRVQRPLRGRPRVLGALLALNRVKGGPFTLQDEILLGIYAGQSALAVEHARRARSLSPPG